MKRCHSWALVLCMGSSIHCIGDVERKTYQHTPETPDLVAPTEDMPHDLWTGHDSDLPSMHDSGEEVDAEFALDLSHVADLEDASSSVDMPVGEDMFMREEDMFEPPTFTATRSAQIARATCAETCAGELVRYSSTRSSLLSEEDAALQAHLDVLASAQAHANATGTCICQPEECGCENFINHGPGSPHLYYDVGRGVYVGDVIAQCAPLFWIEGLMSDYRPMQLTGSVENTNKKVYHYIVAGDAVGRNTHVKSAGAGCQDYPDVRLQPQDTRERTAWETLPTLPPVTPNTDEIPIFVASELENADANAYIWGAFAVGQFPNLQYRVDGGAWTPFKAPEPWTFFVALPPFTHTSTETFLPAKDFIFDLTMDSGATIQRFTVFRRSKGGHYSSITAMTRQDGRVWLTAQLANPETRQYLVDNATGRIYPSVAPYHYLFDLGHQSNGEHHFSLFSAEDVLLDPDVMIRVQATP